jgi:prolyl 4-hydroxylase
MKPHWNNKSGNFIGGWYMEDDSLCDKLINYFNDSENKIVGEIWENNQRSVNPKTKESIDVRLNGDMDLSNEYNYHLQDCVREYGKLYEYSDQTTCSWDSAIEVPNIQYYKPGGGFKIWHFERTGTDSMTRNLVFMTYLNTVTDLGGTAFKYQNLEVQAEKGLTLIWPSDWTHTHKGIVSPTQEKYILTGWFNYVL